MERYLGKKGVFSYKIFDKKYIEYDKWYEKNPELTQAEIECIKSLLNKTGAKHHYSTPNYNNVFWELEIGVGTGIFAKSLSIPVGLDPAVNPLKIAFSRGIKHAVRGVGEKLPFRDNLFNIVLIVVTLCFAEDPENLLREAYRVLSREGKSIVCIVPRNSFLGINYLKKRAIHTSFYSHAKFFSIRELLDIILRVGFTPLLACSTLEWRGVSVPRPVEMHYIEYPRFTDSLTKYGFYCILSKK